MKRSPGPGCDVDRSARRAVDPAQEFTDDARRTPPAARGAPRGPRPAITQTSPAGRRRARSRASCDELRVERAGDAAAPGAASAAARRTARGCAAGPERRAGSRRGRAASLREPGAALAARRTPARAAAAWRTAAAPATRRRTPRRRRARCARRAPRRARAGPRAPPRSAMPARAARAAPARRPLRVPHGAAERQPRAHRVAEPDAARRWPARLERRHERVAAHCVEIVAARPAAPTERP